MRRQRSALSGAGPADRKAGCGGFDLQFITPPTTRAEVLDPREAPELARALTPPGREGATERLFRIQVEAYDWNCPQHITPRFTEEEVGQAIRPFLDRIAALEAELERMKP